MLTFRLIPFLSCVITQLTNTVTNYVGIEEKNVGIALIIRSVALGSKEVSNAFALNFRSMSRGGMMQFSLIFLLSLNALIVSTEGIWSANSREFEVDYILSGALEFSSLIEKFKSVVNRFECPKRWKYLGGSCYYLSNTSSTSIEANETCHQLHSNRSQLMQIRNIVQLFYAANILLKNNLSSLMVEMDRDLFNGNHRSFFRSYLYSVV